MTETNVVYFYRLVEEVTNEVERALHQTLLDAGQLGQETARDTNLFKNTGPLRDATNFKTIDQFSGFVLADKPYAQYLEYGNPYEGFVIKPVNAKALHFFSNGEEFFVKSSTAHGPLPFMENAQHKVEEDIEKLWEHNFDKFVKGT